MRKMLLSAVALGAILAPAFTSAPAQAQAIRTWVSGVGDDANPCSRTAPCKTFAGAIFKTAAGGEINCIDGGGFGVVVIVKSMTIDCASTLGSILGAQATGVVINDSLTTPGTIDVALRNLSIDGAGNGIDGISIISGASLLVENVQIFGFTGNGINASPAGPVGSTFNLHVRNATIHKNNVNGGAILLRPAANVRLAAFIEGTTMFRNGFGIVAQDGAAAVVRSSMVTNSSSDGFVAASNGAPVEIDLDRVVSAGNAATAVQAVGENAIIRLSNTTLHSNGGGIQSNNGGQIISYGNNTNSGSGGPTSTAPQQ